MDDKKVTFLYQPNLTCAFDLTKNFEGNVWTLVIRNHEKAGICLPQLAEQLWNFANVFTKRLVEEKLWDLKGEQVVPPVNVIPTHCLRYIMNTFIIVSENGERLTPSIVALILGEFAKQYAASGNYKGINYGDEQDSAAPRD